RTGICTIVDMDSLEIEVDVNEAYIQRVKPGQKVTATLDAYPGSPMPARVIAIVPAADRERATVRVRIGFLERDPRVLPDMGVKVAFHDAAAPPPRAQAQAGVLVPTTALRDDGSKHYVLVVDGGHARRRDIDGVHPSGRHALVGAGLAPGEHVIVNGPEGLSEGDRV